MADERYQKPYVEMKRKWADPWVTWIDVQADSWDVALSPARQVATISYEYGNVSSSGGGAVKLGRLLWNRQGWFVRILRQRTPEETAEQNGLNFNPLALWVGVLVRPFDDEAHDTPEMIGTERGRCLGLEYLLEKSALYQSIFDVSGTLSTLNTLLPFNIRNSKTNAIQGNRTSAKVQTDPRRPQSYVFSDKDGALWRAHDVIEYLVAQFAPPELNWSLGGSTNLLQYTDAWKPFTNIKQGIDSLCNRARGHAWRPVTQGVQRFVRDDVGNVVAAPLDENDISVAIFPVFGDDTAGLGEAFGFELTPNSDIVNIDGEDDRIVGTVNVSEDTQSTIDRVVVVGEPIIVMQTLIFPGGGGDGAPALVKGWTATLEAAYKAADKKGRMASQLEAVYRYIVVDTDLISRGPAPDDNGFLVETAEEFAGLGARLLRVIPLLKQDDDVVAGVSSGPKQLRKPLVYTLLSDTTTFAPLDKIGEGDPEMGNYKVKMLDGQMGFSIGAQRGGNHIAGLNHFSESGVKVQPKFDYEEMEATVAWASSERLKLIVDLPGAPETDVPKTLVIRVPGAQAWWLAPNTTTDITDGERGVVEGPLVLRSDRDRLALIGALAKIWYTPKRRTLNVQFAGTLTEYLPGQIVSTVDHDTGAIEINTIISRVNYDAIRGTTLVQTQFSELEAVTFANQGGGRRGLR